MRLSNIPRKVTKANKVQSRISSSRSNSAIEKHPVRGVPDKVRGDGTGLWIIAEMRADGARVDAGDGVAQTHPQEQVVGLAGV